MRNINHFTKPDYHKRVSLSWGMTLFLLVTLYLFGRPLWTCAKHLENISSEIKQTVQIHFGPGPQDE